MEEALIGGLDIDALAEAVITALCRYGRAGRRCISGEPATRKRSLSTSESLAWRCTTSTRGAPISTVRIVGWSQKRAAPWRWRHRRRHLWSSMMGCAVGAKRALGLPHRRQ